jgi:hypothetical protein
MSLEHETLLTLTREQFPTIRDFNCEVVRTGTSTGLTGQIIATIR